MHTSLRWLQWGVWIALCWLLGVAASGQALPVQAADPEVQTGRWFLYDSSTANFPATEDILSMAIDSRQRLWIGTRGAGIAMFDGFTWTRYTRANTSNQLLSDSVQFIGRSSGGSILIGTSDGANHFNPATNTWTTYTTADDLPHNNVTAYAIAGSANTLFPNFFATYGGGLAFCSDVLDIDGTLNCAYESVASGDLPSDFIFDMAVTGSHRWVVTADGVVWVRQPLVGPEQRTTFNSANSPGCPLITEAHSVTLDYPHNRVWFGLAQAVFDIDGGPGEGACVYDMDSGEWRHFNPANSGLKGETVMDIAVDREGRAWFASVGSTGGLFVYTWVTNSCCWEDFYAGNPAGTIPSNFVRSAVAGLDRVFFGHDSAVSSVALHWQSFAQPVQALASLPGMLSVGTPNGLLAFDGVSFSTPLVAVNVQEILAVAPNNLWVATTTGVHHWNGSQWMQFTAANSGLASDNVTSLAQDSLGRIWGGTAANGVSVYNASGNNWATFDTTSTLPADAVRDVAATAAGDVWVATSGGLSRYDASVWSTYTTANGLPSNDISAVEVDSAGTVWAGTAVGAASWDGTTWTNAAAEMPADEVLTIHGPATGGVWFGVVGGAIFHNGSAWDYYRARNSGLIHERIGALTSDGDGGVWFGGVQYADGPLNVPDGLFVRSISDEPLGDEVPAVSSFTPDSGVAGTLVTINGSGFTPGTRVYFGATAQGGGQLAEVVANTGTTLEARLPSQAVQGRIRVANDAGGGISAASFAPIPRILDIQPKGGGIGAPIEIRGTNLRGIGFPQVKFGSSTLTSLPVYGIAHDLLKVYVPADATSGQVILRTGPDPMVANNFDFEVFGQVLKVLDVEIHQGLPQYQHRVQGKSTVVRVFLGSDDPNGSCAYVTSAVLQILERGESTPEGYVNTIENGGVPNNGEFCGDVKQDGPGGSIDFVIPGSDLTGDVYFMGAGFSVGFVNLLTYDLGQVGFAPTGDLLLHIAAPGNTLWDDQSIYPGIGTSGMGSVMFNRNLLNMNRIYPVRDGVGGPTSQNGLRYLLNPTFRMCNGVDDGYCDDAPNSYDFKYDFWQENQSGVRRLCIVANILKGLASDDGSVMRFSGSFPAGEEKRMEFLALARPGATLPTDLTTLLSVNTGNANLAVTQSQATMTFGNAQCGSFTYSDVILYSVNVRNNGSSEVKDVIVAIDYDQSKLDTPGPGGMVLGNDNTMATYLVPGSFFLVDGSLGAKYDPPLDLNYNGSIDSADLDLFVEEFDNWNPATGQFGLSFDLAQVGPKDVIRNFRDSNGNLMPDSNETWAPYLERTKRVRYAVYNVPREYMDVYNDANSVELQFSQLWLWRGVDPFTFMGLSGQASGDISMWSRMNSTNSIVHETGHNTGLAHSPQQSIPNVPAGYNVFERRVILGEELLSTMGDPVGGPIEDVLFNPLQHYTTFYYFYDLGQEQSSALAAQTSGPLFHLAGILHRDGQVEISSSYLTSGLSPTSVDAAGEYWLRFIGASNTTDYRFDVSFTVAEVPEGEGQPDQAPFAITQPFPPDTQFIELWDADGPLYSLAVSDGEPAVAVQTPNGGEIITADGTLTIRWSGNDPDGDPLTYAVRYSADNGVTWLTLAAATMSTEVVVPAANLPGSANAFVEVWASDGVHTASDRSNAVFAVEGKPPLWAAIDAPNPGAKVVQSQLVWLVGGGYDVEDGPLAGSHMRWHSDLAGLLGSGDALSATLPVGVHQITLEATDSANLSASDMITLEVLADFDVDGLADVYEQEYASLAWWNPHDAGSDGDDDGLTARSESAWGTNPENDDSDGDGVKDGTEAAAGSLPTDPNSLPQAPKVMASVESLAFSMAAGAANPATVPVLVISSNPTSLTWSATANQSWLRLNVVSGLTPSEVSISVEGAGLAIGVYAGEVAFLGENGSTWTVPVILTIADPSVPQIKVRLPKIGR